MLPVKETAPIAVPRTIDVDSPTLIGVPKRVSRRNSATDTSAAVAPPFR